MLRFSLWMLVGVLAACGGQERRVGRIVQGQEKAEICHRKGDQGFVLISISTDAATQHLEQHGDFPWDATLYDLDCRSPCGETSDRALSSCTNLPASCGGAGLRWVNPGQQTGEAFQVYCDDEGWMLFGKMAGNAFPQHLFDVVPDSGLVSAGPAASGEFSWLALERFDAYGNSWRIRTTTQTGDSTSPLQEAIYKPAPGESVLPSEAGSNWRSSQGSANAVHARLVHLTRSSTTGSGNTTWLPVPVCSGGHCDQGGEASQFAFTYRCSDASIATCGAAVQADCLDGNDQTQICHSVQGGAVVGFPEGGSMTAAFGMRDDVGHAWSKAWTGWIYYDAP